MEYWQIKQYVWPELTAMAFDLLAVPAMSSECERVFSSCAKMTTPDSGKLLGKTLCYHQCLKNWQRRGAIELVLYNNAVKLDFGSDNDN
jgi:predicted lipoprotein with Yx(FWY)xxD motif